MGYIFISRRSMFFERNLAYLSGKLRNKLSFLNICIETIHK